MSDILTREQVEALRIGPNKDPRERWIVDLCHTALHYMDEVARLKVEVERMRVALRYRDALWCKALLGAGPDVIEAVTSRFMALRPKEGE